MKTFLALVPVGAKFRWAQQMPPLGISSIGAFLSENGHEVFIHDGSLDESIEPIVKKILEFRPRVIGLSFTTLQAKNAVVLADKIKSFDRNIIVVAGGVHATPLARPFLKHCSSFDIVVRGEGEQTMLELVDVIGKGGRLNEVRGIVYRHDNEIIENQPRPLIGNLDALPFASSVFHSFDSSKYSFFEDMPLDGQEELKRFPMMTTRGCPFSCTFCYAQTMWGCSYRMRSPNNIVDEIGYLTSEHKANYVRFYDDNFCVSEKHTLDICKEIQKRKLIFQWRCEARVGPTPLSKQMLQEMRKSGCHMIELGVESGSGRILESIKKQITIPMIEKAFKLCHEVGLATKAFIILGFPGERAIDFLNTIKILSRIKPRHVNMGACQILPGTAMYHLLKKEGIIDEDMWFKYDREDIPRYYEFVNTFERYLILARRKALSYYCHAKGFL